MNCLWHCTMTFLWIILWYLLWNIYYIYLWSIYLFVNTFSSVAVTIKQTPSTDKGHEIRLKVRVKISNPLNLWINNTFVWRVNNPLLNTLCIYTTCAYNYIYAFSSIYFLYSLQVLKILKISVNWLIHDLQLTCLYYCHTF